MAPSQKILDSRLALQALLEDVLGSTNVYFQPPTNIMIEYPAIVYQRSTISEHHANNLLYNKKVRYRVTVIDRDPDSEILDRMLELPLCTFTQHFVSDSLNHDVYNLYF